MSLALRKDGGVVSTFKPLIFRVTGGEVLLATPIGLRGVGGENLRGTGGENLGPVPLIL